MKFALISDLHGNLPACEAVLANIETRGVDKVLCLGDMVGYGPCPGEVLDRLRDVGAEMIMGNHDAAVVNLMDYSDFRKEARDIVDWTRSQLNPLHLATLVKLPYLIENEKFTCVHSEMVDPESFYYLDQEEEARATWTVCDARIVFIGHTHQPMVHRLSPRDDYDAFRHHGFKLLPEHRYVINVGSVGFPRDGDYRASYVIYDDVEDTISWFRVPYDVEGLRDIANERMGHHDEVHMLLNSKLRLGVMGENTSHFSPTDEPGTPPKINIPRSSGSSHRQGSPSGETGKRNLSPGMLVAAILTLGLLFAGLAGLVHVATKKDPQVLQNEPPPPQPQSPQRVQVPTKILEVKPRRSVLFSPDTPGRPGYNPRLAPSPTSTPKPLPEPGEPTHHASMTAGQAGGTYPLDTRIPAIISPANNTLSLTDTARQPGGQSLLIQKKAANLSAITIDLTQDVPVGRHATLTAYLRAKTPSAPSLVCTLREESNGYKTDTILKRLTLSADNWQRVELPLQRNAQHADDAYNLLLRMPAAAAELYFDDLAITLQ